MVAIVATVPPGTVATVQNLNLKKKKRKRKKRQSALAKLHCK